MFWKSKKVVDVPTKNLSEALAYKVGVLKTYFMESIFFKTQTSKLTFSYKFWEIWQNFLADTSG